MPKKKLIFGIFKFLDIDFILWASSCSAGKFLLNLGNNLLDSDATSLNRININGLMIGMKSA